MLITYEKIISQLEQCSKDYQAGKFDTRKQYLRKFNSIKNLNSITNQVKRWGAKVTRDARYVGVYIYHGKNFTVSLNEASCETTWWEVATYEDGVSQELQDHFYDWNMYDTKGDCVAGLLAYDKQVSEENK